MLKGNNEPITVFQRRQYTQPSHVINVQMLDVYIASTHTQNLSGYSFSMQHLDRNSECDSKMCHLVTQNIREYGEPFARSEQIEKKRASAKMSMGPRVWHMRASVTMCTIQHCYHTHTHKSSAFDGTGKWSFCPWITIYINVRGNRTMRRVGKKKRVHMKTITTANSNNRKSFGSLHSCFTLTTLTHTPYFLSVYGNRPTVSELCYHTFAYASAQHVRSAWATFILWRISAHIRWMDSH